MSKELIAGIDEAGRGAFLGPMVVAGVATFEDVLEELSSFGIRDSKSLTPRSRISIYERLVEMPVSVEVAVVEPSEIDSASRAKGGKGINQLEAEVMRGIIERLKPNRVYVDAPLRDADKFGKLLVDESSRIRLICENKADSKYLIVGAASIVAKVERDLLINSLRKQFGEVSSGYPSDFKGISSLRRRFITERELPDFVRYSWRTIERLQPTLDDY